MFFFVSSDCIGSAFNSKGIMQCPNCRQIEWDQWLYARGPVSSQNINNDDWVIDEDIYDFAQLEVFVVRDSKLSSYSDTCSCLGSVPPNPFVSFETIHFIIIAQSL